MSKLKTENYQVVMDKLIGKIAEKQQQERLNKCMAVFNSLPICTDSTGFYVWARMAAKQIMDGDGGTSNNV